MNSEVKTILRRELDETGNERIIYGTEKISAYTVEECSAYLPVISFHDLQRNHKVVKFAGDFMTLDTETSHTDLITAWVYQWAVKFKGLYVYGRRPDEIIKFMEIVAEHYRLNDSKKIIIYIHNAAYDVQYLKNFLFEYDPTAKFLALDSHAFLMIDVLGFRILCSYKLSNMSLDALSKNYATKFVKAVGEIDYNVVRYQDSNLDSSDWFYMFSDVASQYDGILGYLKMQGYKYAYQAPITSTGFVRTACRNASKNDNDWRDEFLNGRLSLEQYNLARQCFMGGVCIASFLYSGLTIRVNNDKCEYINKDKELVIIEESLGLAHKDFTSSYPARQFLKDCYFPVGSPTWYGDIDDLEELEELCRDYCVIFTLTLENVHIKKGVTAPCIPHSKCISPVGDLKVNGKIVSAKRLTIVVCELDYKWIKRQYTGDVVAVEDVLFFERGDCPDWLKDEVYEYFNNKCTLKGVDDMLYNKSKAYLNSIYGMTATAIIRDEYEMDKEHVLKLKKFEDKDKEREYKQGKLNKYYGSRNSFMRYDAAIYTTAWARDALYTMIECTGDNDGTDDDLTDVYKNFLYCDTDSVFYIVTRFNKKRMDAYTAECLERAKRDGAYVGDKFLGLPEDEPPIRAFRALHAKCYAMEEYNKKKDQYELVVVVAGIPKKSTKWIGGEPVVMTNAEELGSIDNLEDGFTFEHCGGTRCVYYERPIETIDINGHSTLLSSSAVIDNIVKELSDTMWTKNKNYDVLELHQETL